MVLWLCAPSWAVSVTLNVSRPPTRAPELGTKRKLRFSDWPGTSVAGSVGRVTEKSFDPVRSIAGTAAEPLPR